MNQNPKKIYIDEVFIQENFPDQNFFYELCKNQIEDFKEKHQSFSSAIANNDHKQIKYFCHYFKSSIESLGWVFVHEKINNLSKSSDKPDVNIKCYFEELYQAVNETARSLNLI